MRVLKAIAVWSLAAVALVGALVWVRSGGLEDAGRAVAAWEMPLAGLRVALIGALWLGWKPLVLRLKGLGEAGREYLASRRHFYAVCLCAVELLVVQNVIGLVASS